jgi:hypothetical protein
MLLVLIDKEEINSFFKQNENGYALILNHCWRLFFFFFYFLTLEVSFIITGSKAILHFFWLITVLLNRRIYIILFNNNNNNYNNYYCRCLLSDIYLSATLRHAKNRSGRDFGLICKLSWRMKTNKLVFIT